jgi:hypothetical protein
MIILPEIQCVYIAIGRPKEIAVVATFLRLSPQKKNMKLKTQR